VNLPEPYARPTPASVIRITRRSDEAGRRRGDRITSEVAARSLVFRNTRQTFDEGIFVWVVLMAPGGDE